MYHPKNNVTFKVLLKLSSSDRTLYSGFMVCTKNHKPLLVPGLLKLLEDVLRLPKKSFMVVTLDCGHAWFPFFPGHLAFSNRSSLQRV